MPGLIKGDGAGRLGFVPGFQKTGAAEELEEVLEQVLEEVLEKEVLEEELEVVLFFACCAAFHFAAMFSSLLF